jgi:hypothetical protein
MPLTKATTNVVNLDKDTTINGMRVGLGAGNIGTNTCVGSLNMSSNTTGLRNTAVGHACFELNTIGSYNTAVGAVALRNNTIGDGNSSIGHAALGLNTTGSGNTAVGSSSLGSNTIGNYNVAIGTQALSSNLTGNGNVAIGGSGTLFYNEGNENTAVGKDALQNNTIGFHNTAVGLNSLLANTTGVQNTAIGVNALTTNSAFDNVTGLGHGTQVTGTNQVQVGNAATTVYAYGAVQNRSDIRDKADVRDTELGLEFVNALRPVDFKWDMREDYRPEAPKPVIEPAELKEDASDEEKAKYAEELAAYNAYKVKNDKWLEDVKLANITHDGSKKRSRFHHGLIAQEVKVVLEAKGIDFGGFQDHSIKGGDDVLSIGYEELIAPMLKAIQELSAEVAALKAK